MAFDPQQHVRGGTHCFARDTGDDYFGIRRARAIRFKLGVKADERLDITPGLLDALLLVPEYKDVDFGTMPDLQRADDPEFTPDQVKGWLKESNREAARRVPGLLELTGLTIETATGAEAGTVSAAQMRLESLLELLARQEHDGWMAWHFTHGWRFANARDDRKKLHHLLIPYADLEDAGRTKDRSQIRQFPRFAAMAGLRVVPG